MVTNNDFSPDNPASERLLQKVQSATMEEVPFKHIVIDNFLGEETVSTVVSEVQELSNSACSHSFTRSKDLYQYNKFTFEWPVICNTCPRLRDLFIALNSDAFISKLEDLSGITGLIRGNTELRGGGVHRIMRGGFLQNHTDFNTYEYNGSKLDRRINLLIYLNEGWEEHHGGDLWLCDYAQKKCVKRVKPLIDRCVIFNTTNRSVHGHPIPLNAPVRESLAVYYYTRNTQGELDFEGDMPHSTLWHTDIEEEPVLT